MRFLRINTYKNYRKALLKKFLSIKKERLSSKSKIKNILLALTIAGTALFSTSIAFADIKISDYLEKWYEDRLKETEEFLTATVEKNANQQKAALLKQVREQAEQSVKELQEYAVNQQQIYNENIKKKANETVNIIEEQNQNDVEKTKKRIEEQIHSENENETSGQKTTDAVPEENVNVENNPPTEELNKTEKEPIESAGKPGEESSVDPVSTQSEDRFNFKLIGDVKSGSKSSVRRRSRGQKG